MSTPNGLPELQLECSHYGHILALLIKVFENQVLVGDLLRSITLLTFNTTQEAVKSLRNASDVSTCSLIETARDFNVNAMRAVEFFSPVLNNGLSNEVMYLGAEDFGNVFIARKQGSLSSSISPEERGRLLIGTEFHVGDCINVFRPGSLNGQSHKSAIQTVLAIIQKCGVQVSDAIANSDSTEISGNFQSVMFGTVGGTLGVVISIPQVIYHFFNTVEASMRQVLQGIGGLSHDEFRSLYNGRRHGGHNNSVDGELLEMFPSLPHDQMQKVTQRVNDAYRSAALSSKKTERYGGSLVDATGGTATLHQKNLLTGASMELLEVFTSDDIVLCIEEMMRLH